MISIDKWNHSSNWKPISQYLELNRIVTHRKCVLIKAVVLDWLRIGVDHADLLIHSCEQFADTKMSRDDFERFVKPLQHFNDERTKRVQARLIMDDTSLQTFLTIAHQALFMMNENHDRTLTPAERCTNLLRELFTRAPVPFPDEWKRESVIDLARTVYDGKQFAFMPILGDLLAESGCDDPEILEHCRHPIESHVRGCWLLDLILGKE